LQRRKRVFSERIESDQWSVSVVSNSQLLRVIHCHLLQLQNVLQKGQLNDYEQPNQTFNDLTIFALNF
jgi:hypothetical protein